LIVRSKSKSNSAKPWSSSWANVFVVALNVVIGEHDEDGGEAGVEDGEFEWDVFGDIGDAVGCEDASVKLLLNEEWFDEFPVPGLQLSRLGTIVIGEVLMMVSSRNLGS